jgi:hypothetical protein
VFLVLSVVVLGCGWKCLDFDTIEDPGRQNGNNEKTAAASPNTRGSRRKVNEGVSETVNIVNPPRKGKRSSKQQHGTILGTQTELENIEPIQNHGTILGTQTELDDIETKTKDALNENKDDEVIHDDQKDEESGKDGTEEGSVYNGEEDDDDEEDTDEDTDEHNKSRKRKKPEKKTEDAARTTTRNASQSSIETHAQDEEATPR